MRTSMAFVSCVHVLFLWIHYKCSVAPDIWFSCAELCDCHNCSHLALLTTWWEAHKLFTTALCRKPHSRHCCIGFHFHVICEFTFLQIFLFMVSIPWFSAVPPILPKHACFILSYGDRSLKMFSFPNRIFVFIIFSSNSLPTPNPVLPGSLSARWRDFCKACFLFPPSRRLDCVLQFY